MPNWGRECKGSGERKAPWQHLQRPWSPSEENASLLGCIYIIYRPNWGGNEEIQQFNLF